ncbi:MAG TPA: hypothetical protein VGQ69_11565 [Gemmatimonadales bacterium]|jgi:hypothetical protein|nr:hypothetical protein [Gemmatimonadales bacterium]
MFNTIFGLLALGITVVSGVLAFGFARGFVRRRLRFVDAVRSPLTPFVAGGLGLLVAAPFTLLPLVGGATVAVVGLGAGLGAKSGVTAIRRGDV